MNCPKCNEKLPYFRKPTSLGQLLSGGWTCANCQAVLDSKGREIIGPYKTVINLLLLVLLYGGVALSNYLVFFAGQAGRGMLALVLTLILVFCFLGAAKPRVHPND